MSLFKKLTLNAVSIYGSRLIQSLLQFVVLAFILSRMDKQAYGAALLIISIQATIELLRGGIGKATYKYIAEYHAKGTLDKACEVFSASFAIQSTVGLIGLVLCFILAPHVTAIFGLPAALEPEVSKATMVVGFGVLLNSSLIPWQHAVMAHERYDLNSLATLFGVTVRVLLIFIFLSFSNRFLYIVLATVLGLFSERIINIYVSSRVAPYLRLNLKHLSRRAFKTIYSFSSLDLLQIVSGSLYRDGSLFVAARLLSLSAVAELGIVFTLTNFLKNFITQFTHMFIPVISRLHAQFDRDRILKVVQQGSRVSVFVAGSFLAALLPWIDSFYRLWLGPDFVSLAKITSFLLVGELLYCSVATLHSMLGGFGKVAFDGISHFLITALGLLVAIVLTLLTGHTENIYTFCVGLFIVRFLRFVTMPIYALHILKLRVLPFMYHAYLRGYCLLFVLWAISLLVPLQAHGFITLGFLCFGTMSIFLLSGFFIIFDAEFRLKTRQAAVGAFHQLRGLV